MASTGHVVKLRISGDITGAFQDVAMRGRRTDAVPQEFAVSVYRMVAKSMFTGPLIDVEESKKVALIKFLHQNASSTSISTEVYKEKAYVVADLGNTNVILNDIKFNQSGRVAYLLNETLLKLLKDFSAPVVDAPEVDGVKFNVKILHKNLTETDAAPLSDSLELYAPVTLIGQFAKADITNQQFIDGCVVLVNGSRIAVTLTQ